MSANPQNLRTILAPAGEIFLGNEDRLQQKKPKFKLRTLIKVFPFTHFTFMPADNLKQENSRETNSSEVVKSFLTQFSNNQNHQQTLFIQFLSSVVIVLIGYAFVFSNTSGHPSKKTTKNKTVTLLPSTTRQIYDTTYVLPPIAARPFESIKNKEGNILSYGLIHLVIIYLFSQMVLIILCLLILHMGYSYRRDQVVVNKMRKDFLPENSYETYFENFSGLNKKVYNYLPNFNSILFGGIFIIQILLYLSIYVFFNQFDPNETFLEDFFLQNVNYFQAKIFLSIPFLVSLFFYTLYFIKYNKKVNNLDHYRHISIIKITNKKTLSLIAHLSLVLSLFKFLIWLNNESNSILAASILSISNAVACYISAYTQIRSTKSSRTNYVYIFKMTLHGVIFLVSSVLIFLFLFNPINYNAAHFMNNRSTFIFILIAIILLTGISHSIKKNFILKEIENEFKLIIRKQIGIEGYFLLSILACLILDVYINAVVFDKYLAGIIGLLALIWGIRRLSTALDITLNRNKNKKLADEG